MPDPRQIIRDRAAERGLSFSALSIMAGKNVAYVQQYVERGTPRQLPDEPRRLGEVIHYLVAELGEDDHAEGDERRQRSPAEQSPN